MKLSHVILFSVIAISPLLAENTENFSPTAPFKPEETIDLSRMFIKPQETQTGNVTAMSEDSKTEEPSASTDQTSPSAPQVTSISVAPSPEESLAHPALNPSLKNGTGLSAVGELLVFQAAEDGLAFAYQGQAVDTQHYRNAASPDFNWNCGFRVGLGYDLPYDGWDLKLTWMELQNHASGSTNFDEGTGYQIWTAVTDVLPGNTVSASSSLKIDLDQVDLTLGRAFRLSPHLTVRPNLGLRADWIFQRYKVDFSTSAGSQKTAMTQRFFSFGFSGSVTGNWTFPYGMSLFSDIGLSAGLGFFSVLQKGFEEGDLQWRFQNSFRSVKPVFDFALGFQWDNCCIKGLTDDRLGMTLRASYEYHLYLSQNQFGVSSGSPYLETFGSQTGDLGYQGVSISVGFQF